MKKFIILLMVIMLSVTMVITLSSCQKTAATTTGAAATTTGAAETTVAATTAAATTAAAETTAGGKGTVYYLAATYSNTASLLQGVFMEKYGEEAGFDMKLLIAQMDANTQINQMDSAISQKATAIIVRAVDTATLVGTVEKGRDAGIPIINFDGLITSTYFDFQVVIDVDVMGKMAADECLKLLKEKNGSEKGKILEVMGDLGDSFTIIMDGGFMSVMDKYPDITVIKKDTPGWETVAAANVVSDQLTASADIDIIYMHADSRLPAIIPVLEGKGYKPDDIKIVGADGDPAALQLIRDGWLNVTVGINLLPEVYGVYQFIDQVIAKEEIKSGTYDVQGLQEELKIEEWGPTLYVPGMLITKKNVDDPTLWGNAKY